MEKISSALISVYNKEGLIPILRELKKLNITIFSTGGTEKYIKDLGYNVTAVEDITSYPSILGGRVKTLHPKIFGGILNRKKNKNDETELKKYQIPQIDLVIVDLYPFEKTVISGVSEREIIEKIDIGGISLIRAAAKNFKDVFCISDKGDYSSLLKILRSEKGFSSIKERKYYASKAFNISSSYDTDIYNYFQDTPNNLRINLKESKTLRYGENPHQKGYFYGKLEDFINQIHGKEISYNNLLDIDAAVNLILEFSNEKPSFAILKHNNACGFATRDNLKDAYLNALAGDPISAFGGVLICNKKIEFDTAKEIDSLFCEVLIAPSFSNDALKILKSKKNRILLIQKEYNLKKQSIRTCLNGLLFQEKDLITDNKNIFKYVTKIKPSKKEIEDMIFASKLSKHTKSNTIVLVKNKQLLASGTGQTSRVDALKHSIEKALNFNFKLKGAIMASDAFFPFPDCVEIANQNGIKSIIQPGGSIRDNLSIEYCNKNKMSMVFTGIRHFKH
ncbi:MAG: bifunctional phosphoribosylaminoimidazolecarboxamide formyltransferase/IMP cyclohydrolase [Flavobacteriaceae bacterium]|nr:bifunctional phosphoribosylaminoimidazolecarboxamide formyltransferase/IMP cyclohydrolase [Flavobacteriaceae bacterium]